MRPGFLLSNRCACQGCAGKPKGLGPGPARPPHAGRCDKPRRSEPEYGPFCKVCYRHYLCTHCGERAVDPEAEPEDHTLRGVCSACVGSREAWCECPGCGEGDARHVHHSDSGAHCARPRDRHRGAHNFCASCRRAWRCASCQREVTVCPERPTGPRCSACIGPSPPAFLEDSDVPGVLLAQRCLCTKADRCEHGPYLCAHVKSEGPETHGLCVACLEHSTCECGSRFLPIWQMCPGCGLIREVVYDSLLLPWGAAPGGRAHPEWAAVASALDWHFSPAPSNPRVRETWSASMTNIL